MHTRRSPLYRVIPLLFAVVVAASVVATLGACRDTGEGAPVEVAPGDGMPEDGVPADGVTDGATPDAPTDAPTDAPRWPGAGEGRAIWVVDAAGTPVGVLVRRGTDDSLSSATVYDRVEVFNPSAGLFFEVTMTDGETRFPTKVYFKGSGCTEPVGVAVGACQDCRSGFGVGIRHDGEWYRVIGGRNWETISNAASHDSGVASSCVAHSSSSTKGFPVEKVAASAAPPATFAAPLRFDWR